jgi:hypothetical protein
VNGQILTANRAQPGCEGGSWTTRVTAWGAENEAEAVVAKWSATNPAEPFGDGAASLGWVENAHLLGVGEPWHGIAPLV